VGEPVIFEPQRAAYVIRYLRPTVAQIVVAVGLRFVGNRLRFVDTATGHRHSFRVGNFIQDELNHFVAERTDGTDGERVRVRRLRREDWTDVGWIIDRPHDIRTHDEAYDASRERLRVRHNLDD